MTITMEQCIEALQGFNKVANAKLPFKQTYMIAKNIKSLEAIVSPFETKRNEYIQDLKTASYDEDGKQVVPDEAAEKFREDVRALLDKKYKVEIEMINLKEEDCGDLTASDIKGCIDYINVE